MKVIKLSFLLLFSLKNILTQFNNPFNSAYSSNLLKKQPNSFSSFYFLNGNNQARTETPVASKYNLSPTTQVQQPNNNIMQSIQQIRQQFGTNYSSPAARVQFTPTSQQQVTNGQFLTANDITTQNVPQIQNSIQQSLRGQQASFNQLPQKGEVLIGQPQNFSQQIQNQNLQNQIKPEALSLANQLSFDFNSTQAQQALLNQQLAQPQAQQLQTNTLQPQENNLQTLQGNLTQTPQQPGNAQPDLLALLQQFQNPQGQTATVQQPQNQPQNQAASLLSPDQQQLQLLIQQLSQTQNNQQASQKTQETLSNNLTNQPPAQIPQNRPKVQEQKKVNTQPVDDEEDILSDFFKQQEQGNIDDFFGSSQKTQQKQPQREIPKKQNIDPVPSQPKPAPKKSSGGDINLFELFNNQGSSNSIGNSELQGEVVHYIDDPSQLNASEPEVTSIDQFLAAGEIPGGGPGGMPF